MRTAEIGIDRFTTSFETDTARKKYNASLRVIKEAEINFALGTIYKGLADEHLTDALNDEAKASSTTIGSTSITEDPGLLGGQAAGNFLALSDNYNAQAAALLSSLYPPTVQIQSEGYSDSIGLRGPIGPRG